MGSVPRPPTPNLRVSNNRGVKCDLFVKVYSNVEKSHENTIWKIVSETKPSPSSIFNIRGLFTSNKS